jgi:hypothetical protein
VHASPARDFARDLRRADQEAVENGHGATLDWEIDEVTPDGARTSDAERPHESAPTIPWRPETATAVALMSNVKRLPRAERRRAGASSSSGSADIARTAGKKCLRSIHDKSKISS